MIINYNIVSPGPKLNDKLDFSYLEMLMFTHLKAYDVWSFTEPCLQQEADDTPKRRMLRSQIA